MDFYYSWNTTQTPILLSRAHVKQSLPKSLNHLQRHCPTYPNHSHIVCPAASAKSQAGSCLRAYEITVHLTRVIFFSNFLLEDYLSTFRPQLKHHPSINHRFQHLPCSLRQLPGFLHPYTLLFVSFSVIFSDSNSDDFFPTCTHVFKYKL